MAHFVHMTPRAEADLEETLAWLCERSIQAAANWHARILAKVQQLEENPEQWPLADESSDLGIPLREVLFGKRTGVFRILFTIDGDTVNILRVRRATRDRLKPGDI